MSNAIVKQLLLGLVSLLIWLTPGLQPAKCGIPMSGDVAGKFIVYDCVNVTFADDNNISNRVSMWLPKSAVDELTLAKCPDI